VQVSKCSDKYPPPPVSIAEEAKAIGVEYCASHGYAAWNYFHDCGISRQYKICGSFLLRKIRQRAATNDPMEAA
jgi:hypothetical protein